MNKYSTFLLGIATVWWVGCQSNLSQSDYIDWVQDYDNHLRAHKKVGDYFFDLQYQPPAYLQLLRQYNGEATEKSPSSTVADDLQYYKLEIGMSDGATDFINYGIESMADKQRKIYYLSYTFQNDIYLREAEETLPCILFHFERSIDLKSGRTFMLAFENKFNGNQEAQLIIDSPLFGGVPIKIKVSKTNIPNLEV